MDALVADSTNDDVEFSVSDPFGFGIRSSTPSVPPGFGPPGLVLPHGHPEPVLPDPFALKPPSRIVPTSAPFTPSRISSLVSNIANPLTNVSGPPTPTQSKTQLKAPESSTAQAKNDLKVFAGSSGLSKAIASHTTQVNIKSEDFPALESSKVKTTPGAVLIKATGFAKVAPFATISKKSASATSIDTVPTVQAVPKATEKRSTPGVLNIVTSSSKLDGAKEVVGASSLFPPLPSSTPVVTASPPLSRPTAVTGKSTKVLPTSKAETPTAGTTPSSTASIFPSNYHVSKQAGLISINKLERSGTPTSENISDNASMTSASISRANSPPPSKVGSAPIRVNTKSMQKKQRKELQKEKEKQELEATVTKPEPEAEIGPIMGRKKKQKKERVVSGATGGSTPAASRPPSPAPVRSTIEEESISETKFPPEPVTEKQSRLEKVSTIKAPDTKGKGRVAKAQRPPTPEPVSTVAEVEEESMEKPTPTPASVLQDLISSGVIHDLPNLCFLKSPASNNRNQEYQIDLQSAMPKLTISPEDRAALLSGQPVRKSLDGPNRIMLTPNGDCVRNLSLEEEELYLTLQANIAKEAGPAAFTSAKHHANGGFTLIGGRAVPNGPPAFFPQLTNPMDPVSKIQRDEALTYINQYVLPSLSTNSQLEKALNANALDAEVLRSSEAASWASWGNDPPAPRPEGSTVATHEGILASGLESMTAHFAIGRDVDRGQPLGNVSLLSLSDAESAMQLAKKETEGLEKRFNALLKKNRRLLLGSGH